MSAPVALILGYGPNVGHHTARAFVAKGYRVAVTSRSQKTAGTDNMGETGAPSLHIVADLRDPSVVADVFAQVKRALGLPSVVIYNASATTLVEKTDPFGPKTSLDAFTGDMAVNTTSVLAAAQQAVAAFAALPLTGVSTSPSKTFIYTGNVLNTAILPGMLGLGAGKSATAYMIESGAAAYADRGFKFYYADERKPDGTPAYMDIDGVAHAAFYTQLAESSTQQTWLQTFVAAEGYKKF